MKYYQKKLFLAKVDIDDNIIGKIERWQAHKKGILHRGLTVILTYQDNIILQHRKHLAFDNCFDLTFSSHQVYKNEKLQTDLQAIYDALKREWNVSKAGLITEPQFLGKFYFKAKDLQSAYTEHEIDYIYLAQLKKIPIPNLNFAYGFSFLTKLKLNFSLAPWVVKMIQEEFFLNFFAKAAKTLSYPPQPRNSQ
jgi:isopentenyl-diphosphate delta-isomerase